MINLFYILERFSVDDYRDFDNVLSIDGYIKIQPDYYAIAITLNGLHYYLINSDCIINNEEMLRLVRNFTNSGLEIIKPRNTDDSPVTDEGRPIDIIRANGIWNKNLPWYGLIKVSKE